MFKPIDFDHEEKISSKNVKGKIIELRTATSFKNCNVYNCVEIRFYKTIYRKVYCELCITDGKKLIARGIGSSLFGPDKKSMSLFNALNDCGIPSKIFIDENTSYNINSVLKILCKNFMPHKDSYITIKKFNF